MTELTLEVGKYYRTRDGRKVGPLYFMTTLFSSEEVLDGYEPLWNKYGRSNFFGNKHDSDTPHLDLVAKWGDAIEGENRETVTLTNFHETARGFCITFDTIDGVPDCSTVRMEEV